MSTFLAALGAFAAHLATSLVLLIAFAVLYSLATPYSELRLIRQGNSAAAVGFGGAMIGFAFPLSQAVRISASVGETLVWGAIALGVQLGGHFLLRRFLPNLTRDIEQGGLAAGVTLAATAVALGLVNAACMVP